jgi:hypothetical protein
VGDGHASQRTGLAGSAQGVGGAGFREGALGIDGDEGVQGRVVRGNAAQVVLAELDAGGFSGRQQIGELFECSVCHDAYSMTFGTRYRPFSVCGATA